MSAADTHGSTYIPDSVSTSLKIHYICDCSYMAAMLFVCSYLALELLIYPVSQPTLWIFTYDARNSPILTKYTDLASNKATHE
jgi:hypothetical protein